MIDKGVKSEFETRSNNIYNELMSLGKEENDHNITIQIWSKICLLLMLFPCSVFDTLENFQNSMSPKIKNIFCKLGFKSVNSDDNIPWNQLFKIYSDLGLNKSKFYSSLESVRALALLWNKKTNARNVCNIYKFLSMISSDDAEAKQFLNSSIQLSTQSITFGNFLLKYFQETPVSKGFHLILTTNVQSFLANHNSSRRSYKSCVKIISCKEIYFFIKHFNEPEATTNDGEPI